MTGLEVATSHTTPYHPEDNSQCERYSETIWRAINLAMEDKNLSKGLWESVLPDVLHSIWSLLCTATNCTHHERTFTHISATRMSLPSWLLSLGKVFLRRHVRGKFDPLVKPVELVETNPLYATAAERSTRSPFMTWPLVVHQVSNLASSRLSQTPVMELPPTQRTVRPLLLQKMKAAIRYFFRR